MCVNCQNDNCNGCTEKFCTSDVTCIQSNFQNINIPAGATLTEVLELLEQYVNTSLLDLQNISITLGGDAACIGLAAGTYSYAQVFNAIISTLCDLVNATAPNTDTVNLGPSITLPACLSGFAGTTTTDLLEYISGVLCGLLAKTPVPGNQPYEGSNDGDMFVPIRILSDVIKGITDNQSYMTTHTTPVTDPNNFSIEVKPLTAVVNYYPVKRTTNETLTFNANKDVYVIMDDKAEISVIEQTIGDPEPSTTNKMLMYKILTSGTGIASLTPRFDTGAVNPTPLAIPDGFVENKMLKVNDINPDKLIDSGVAAGTYGQTQFLQFTVSAKGLVTAVTANFHLAGLANGDIIYYNAANLRFENKPNLSTGTNTYIPRSTGTNFTDSALYEDANSIHSSKTIEGDLTGGSPIGDPVAAIIANGGPMLFVPMTAAAASAITPVEGYVVCVSTTDATFTSTGFWGFHDAAWAKLG